LARIFWGAFFFVVVAEETYLIFYDPCQIGFEDDCFDGTEVIEQHDLEGDVRGVKDRKRDGIPTEYTKVELKRDASAMCSAGNNAAPLL
jgi:hypothetical protein